MIAVNLLLVSFYAGSCVNVVSGYMGCPTPEARQSQIVAKARELVLASNVLLNLSEIEFVQRQMPDVRIYTLTGVCGEDAQYFIEWRLPDARLVISGIGDPYEMDGATVERM